jgi:hypothetical protein
MATANDLGDGPLRRKGETRKVWTRFCDHVSIGTEVSHVRPAFSETDGDTRRLCAKDPPPFKVFPKGGSMEGVNRSLGGMLLYQVHINEEIAQRKESNVMGDS